MKPILTLLASAALVAACGPRKPKLEPPGVRIIELTVESPAADATPFQTRIRVTNGTDALLPAHQLNLNLRLDGRSVARFDHAVGIDIPPLGSEVITLSGSLDSRAVSALATLDSGSRGQVPYRLDGQAETAGLVLDIEYEGWFTATPGKPGSYR